MPASTWAWGSGICRPWGELCSAQLGLEGILEHPGGAIATVIAGTMRTDQSRDKQMWKSPGIKDIRPLRMPKKTRWRQKGESSWGEDAGKVRAEAEVKGTGMKEDCMLLAQCNKGHLDPRFNEGHDRE